MSGWFALDHAMALSLDLTSYVSVSRAPVRMIRCDRGVRPSDALDLLTLAWLRGDRATLESVLGPKARAALADLPADCWRGKRLSGAAVGYRLEDTFALRTDASFTTASGTPCGTQKLEFVETPPGTYRLAHPDVGDLLRVIDRCAE